jgi:hypothetical protein
MDRRFRNLLCGTGLALTAAARAQAPAPMPGEAPNDPLLLLYGAIAVGITLLIYAVMWWFVGRDPEPGVIRPQAAPPADLSPAVARYLVFNHYDNATFMAALVSLAVKGVIYFRETIYGYNLGRHEGPYAGESVQGQLRRMVQDGVPITSDERFVAESLFHNCADLTINEETGPRINAIMRRHAGQLRQQVVGRYLHNNLLYQAIGTGISVVAVLVMAVAFQLRHSAVETVMLLGGLGLIYAMPWLVLPIPRLLRSPERSSATYMLIMLRLSTLFIMLAACHWLLARTPWPMLFTLTLLAALNLLFAHLLRAPTQLGRQVLDRLEGFRRYLAGATDPTPLPASSVPHYERWLPYAMAFNAADAWTTRHRDALNQPGPHGPWYVPGWYAGAALRRGGMAELVTLLQTAWTDAVSSARRPDTLERRQTTDPAADLRRSFERDGWE